MAITTNVPEPTFGPTGFTIPQESEILLGVQKDIDAAFGGGLSPALETPQGQLATTITAIVGNVNETFQKYTQQVDPAFADGRMQDGIARIYDIERNPALPTVVQVLCRGLVGVVIPQGALISDSSGVLYVCTQAGVIAANGMVTLAFACIIPGPVVCAAGMITTIYQAVPGWDSVENVDDGILGTNTETRANFERRRQQSVAHNSIGSLPSVLGAVLTVSGVLDAYVTENDQNTAQTIGGYLLAPNSLYVAVVGGEAQDIGEAIWSKKAPGCGYNGNTPVTVQDTSPGYVPPYPTYTVLFETPDPLEILFDVEIADSDLVPADAATQIQNALVLAFAGADGGPRARIGTELYASRYYAPVALLGSWAQIISIEIGSNNAPSASFTASITGTTLTVSAVASGALGAGQTISDLFEVVALGTTIVSQSSGSAGGTGTYVLNISQTIGSRAMKSAIASLFRVDTRIDQIPTLSAANIKVNIT